MEPESDIKVWHEAKDQLQFSPLPLVGRFGPQAGQPRLANAYQPPHKTLELQVLQGPQSASGLGHPM